MNTQMPLPEAPHPALAVLCDRLHAQGRLRVWSIVITIFGDAIAPRGGVAALAEILALTGRMGIEGGAVRTAMSRLAKEGWVERRKTGRTSHYALTPEGAETFLAATRRIYAPCFTAEVRTAHLAITEGEAPGLPLRPGVGLLLDKAGPTGVLTAPVDLTNAPEWVRHAVLPQDLAAEYDHLGADLTRAHTALRDIPPLDALALRCLSIHFWRRLVLRHPAPPNQITPENWPGLRCHTALAALYRDIIPLSEPWWTTPTRDTEIGTTRFNVLQI